MGGRREMLRECIACGGSITAEHGIGVEKLALVESLFGPAGVEALRRVRAAFDPLGLLNPGKVLPDGPPSDGKAFCSPAKLGNTGATAGLSSGAQYATSDTAGQASSGTPKIIKFSLIEAFYAPLSHAPQRLPAADADLRADDESAAAAIVREAGKSNTPVYPIGGATRLDYGAVARAAGHGTVAGQAQPRDRLPRRRLDDHGRGRRDDGGTCANPGRARAAAADRRAVGRPGDGGRGDGGQRHGAAMLRTRGHPRTTSWDSAPWTAEASLSPPAAGW